MKDKQSETALVALKKMLPKARADYPLKIWVDQGKEFCGAFKNFCLQNDIVLYNTFNDSKSAIAERYIRTIKSKLYKYFNERQTTRYIGQLQKLVKMLNSRSHPILGMAPKNVRPEHTVDLLKKNVPDMRRKWRPRKTSRKFSKKSQSSKKVKLFEYRASANQLLTKVILKISPMKSSKLLLFLDPFATTTKKTPAPSPTA